VGAARLLHLFRRARIGRAARHPTARRGDTRAQPIPPASVACLPRRLHLTHSLLPIPVFPSAHARAHVVAAAQPLLPPASSPSPCTAHAGSSPYPPSPPACVASSAAPTCLSIIIIIYTFVRPSPSAFPIHPSTAIAGHRERLKKASSSPAKVKTNNHHRIAAGKASLASHRAEGEAKAR